MASALVVRVASEGAHPPSICRPATNTWLLSGLSPGRNEHLRASVDHDGIGKQDEDLFNLVVQRVRSRGSELVEVQEIFRRVSILRGSAREVSRILAALSLVRVAGPLPARRPDITRGARSARADWLRGMQRRRRGRRVAVGLRSDRLGESGAAGLFALAGGPGFNFLYIPPPARDRDLGMSVLVVAARFCRRQQALLLVDPPLAWTARQHCAAACATGRSTAPMR